MSEIVDLYGLNMYLDHRDQISMYFVTPFTGCPDFWTGAAFNQYIDPYELNTQIAVYL